MGPSVVNKKSDLFPLFFVSKAFKDQMKKSLCWPFRYKIYHASTDDSSVLSCDMKFLTATFTDRSDPHL